MNPSTDAAARAVIGCIVIAPLRAMTACVSYGITPAHFLAPVDALYSDCLEKFAANKTIDPIALQAVVDRIGSSLEPMYLDRAADSVTTVENCEFYIERLLAEKLCRDIAVANIEAGETAKGATPDNAAATLSAIREKWGSIGSLNTTTETLSEVAHRLIVEWQKPIEDRGGVFWPLEMFNKQIGPLVSEYVVIAAHESVGKTAFACNMAVVNAAAGRRVGVKYIEARREQIVPRFIASLGEVNTLALRQGRAMEYHFDKARTAADRLAELPISVDDALCTTEQLMAWGMIEKARGAKLLIIDNMKHIMVREKTSNLPEMFRAISLGVKRVRDATGIPVILLHHLSGDDQMSWSRDVRRDADILLAMKNDEDESVQPCRANNFVGTWVVQFDVLKNRDGKAGFGIKTRFDKEFQTFHDKEAEPKNDARGGDDE